MDLDYEKYRHHLKSHGLTTEQENEVIDLMWRTMGAAVEEALSMKLNLVRKKILPQIVQTT